MTGKILLSLGILCVTTSVVLSQNQNLFDPFGLLNLFGPFGGTTDANANANALNNLFGLYYLDEYGDLDLDLDFFKRRRRRR
ncbi:hypothetical protein RRG08_034408 [Elysia crispata]|uniref:Uncharacterized protein n=1 Tax=Elysia crispata TaxID=231223 RepID=A0AAE1CWF7_9GAST|nr:hypothetical protein RRG08_034408 [Elysia crispata]